MTTWKECTEERFDNMLSVLPPATMTSLGFLVGEPMTLNAEGIPVYSAFARCGGRYWEAGDCFTVKDFRALSAKDVIGGAQ